MSCAFRYLPQCHAVQKNARHPVGSSASTTRIAPPTGRQVARNVLERLTIVVPYRSNTPTVIPIAIAGLRKFALASAPSATTQSGFRSIPSQKAHDGFRGGANSWPIKAPRSLLPRDRTLWTNSKKPR